METFKVLRQQHVSYIQNNCFLKMMTLINEGVYKPKCKPKVKASFKKSIKACTANMHQCLILKGEQSACNCKHTKDD